MDPGPAPLHWRRSSSHQPIHTYSLHFQTPAPQANEHVPQQILHPLRQRIHNDVDRQREASANATIHNDTLAKHCENLLAELEKKTAELLNLRQACQQQKDLAHSNAGAANFWRTRAGELEADMKGMEKAWEEERGNIEGQNQNNIDALNRTHLEERGDLQETADQAHAQIAELLSTTKQQADHITELEKANEDQATDLASSQLECAAAHERANKAEQENTLLRTKHDEEIASSNERHAQVNPEAHQEILELRKVNEGRKFQIQRLEVSRDRFAACLLLQGVRAVKTNLLMWNTAGRLISRNWQLGKTRRQLQLSEQSTENERKGYQQASAEYTAEVKARKQCQNKYEDECTAHRESIWNLHRAQAAQVQLKAQVTKLKHELALHEGLNKVLQERTREFNQKSVECKESAKELQSCKLELSETKKTQEKESKRANEAEENAMTHLNARREAERERDEMKTLKGSVSTFFFDQSRSDGSSGPATKERGPETSTMIRNAAKAGNRVNEPLIDNEGRDTIRKDSHPPGRNAMDHPPDRNDRSEETTSNTSGISSNRKREASGKLPQVPKKRRTNNGGIPKDHDIYTPKY
ncbi:hypothetical protein AC579_993 [Pseudocercospora musae]|uniref:Uncharacterized protein n=1 Tax=Pseudocercospora musae TaxID=113226 RepID=A0A139HJ79_9PEZI|nr:hypothetical protein AC579_993 [Pseudocercospora musae]